MPLRAKGSRLYWLKHKNRSERLLGSESISQIKFEHISEIMLTDWQHEGVANAFDYEIIENFPLEDKPLIVFGGISEPVQMENLFRRNEVVGVGIGNFLNYKEHAIQLFRKNIQGAPIRSESYSSEVYFL
jgi:cyclase